MDTLGIFFRNFFMIVGLLSFIACIITSIIFFKKKNNISKLISISLLVSFIISLIIFSLIPDSYSSQFYPLNIKNVQTDKNKLNITATTNAPNGYKVIYSNSLQDLKNKDSNSVVGTVKNSKVNFSIDQIKNDKNKYITQNKNYTPYLVALPDNILENSDDDTLTTNSIKLIKNKIKPSKIKLNKITLQYNDKIIDRTIKNKEKNKFNKTINDLKNNLNNSLKNSTFSDYKLSVKALTDFKPYSSIINIYDNSSAAGVDNLKASFPDIIRGIKKSDYKKLSQVSVRYNIDLSDDRGNTYKDKTIVRMDLTKGDLNSYGNPDEIDTNNLKDITHNYYERQLKN